MKENWWGAVIDFDFASGSESEEPSGFTERTGTLSHIYAWHWVGLVGS